MKKDNSRNNMIMKPRDVVTAPFRVMLSTTTCVVGGGSNNKQQDDVSGCPSGSKNLNHGTSTRKVDNAVIDDKTATFQQQQYASPSVLVSPQPTITTCPSTGSKTLTANSACSTGSYSVRSNSTSSMQQRRSKRAASTGPVDLDDDDLLEEFTDDSSGQDSCGTGGGAEEGRERGIDQLDNYQHHRIDNADYQQPHYDKSSSKKITNNDDQDDGDNEDEEEERRSGLLVYPINAAYYNSASSATKLATSNTGNNRFILSGGRAISSTSSNSNYRLGSLDSRSGPVDLDDDVSVSTTATDSQHAKFGEKDEVQEEEEDHIVGWKSGGDHNNNSNLLPPPTSYYSVSADTATRSQTMKNENDFGMLDSEFSSGFLHHPNASRIVVSPTRFGVSSALSTSSSSKYSNTGSMKSKSVVIPKLQRSRRDTPPINTTVWKKKQQQMQLQHNVPHPFSNQPKARIVSSDDDHHHQLQSPSFSVVVHTPNSPNDNPQSLMKEVVQVSPASSSEVSNMKEHIQFMNNSNIVQYSPFVTPDRVSASSVVEKQQEVVLPTKDKNDQQPQQQNRGEDQKQKQTCVLYSPEDSSQENAFSNYYMSSEDSEENNSSINNNNLLYSAGATASSISLSLQQPYQQQQHDPDVSYEVDNFESAYQLLQLPQKDNDDDDGCSPSLLRSTNRRKPIAVVPTELFPSPPSALSSSQTTKQTTNVSSSTPVVVPKSIDNPQQQYLQLLEKIKHLEKSAPPLKVTSHASSSMPIPQTSVVHQVKNASNPAVASISLSSSKPPLKVTALHDITYDNISKPHGTHLEDVPFSPFDSVFTNSPKKEKNDETGAEDDNVSACNDSQCLYDDDWELQTGSEEWKSILVKTGLVDKDGKSSIGSVANIGVGTCGGGVAGAAAPQQEQRNPKEQSSTNTSKKVSPIRKPKNSGPDLTILYNHVYNYAANYVNGEGRLGIGKMPDFLGKNTKNNEEETKTSVVNDSPAAVPSSNPVYGQRNPEFIKIDTAYVDNRSTNENDDSKAMSTHSSEGYGPTLEERGAATFLQRLSDCVSPAMGMSMGSTKAATSGSASTLAREEGAASPSSTSAALAFLKENATVSARRILQSELCGSPSNVYKEPKADDSTSREYTKTKTVSEEGTISSSSNSYIQSIKDQVNNALKKNSSTVAPVSSHDDSSRKYQIDNNYNSVNDVSKSNFIETNSKRFTNTAEVKLSQVKSNTSKPINSNKATVEPNRVIARKEGSLFSKSSYEIANERAIPVGTRITSVGSSSRSSNTTESCTIASSTCSRGSFASRNAYLEAISSSKTNTETKQNVTAKMPVPPKSSVR